MHSREDEINLTEAIEFVMGLMPPAADILRKYFNSAGLVSEYKDEREAVTQADLEVDQFLRDEISKKYPRAKFLTEETSPRNPEDQKALFKSLKNEEDLWIIDSLDGTWNFSKGHPNFAISVALGRKGYTRLGIVYVPMSYELYWAQEDIEGAYLNGQRIYVSKTDRIESSVFECDFPSNMDKRRQTWERQGKVLDVMQMKTMSSAVADLASLVCGRIDAYLNGGLKPWDVAAVYLIDEKAGARVTTPEGNHFNVFEPDIFASNGILHEEFLRRWK